MLRRDMKAAPWPRDVLYQLQADLLDANRRAWKAKVAHDDGALAVAITDRCDAQGKIDALKDEAADRFLFGLANAMDRRLDQVADLFDKLVEQNESLYEMARVVANLAAPSWAEGGGR